MADQTERQPRPELPTITRESTREEVLVAVEAHEQATARLRDDIHAGRVRSSCHLRRGVPGLLDPTTYVGQQLARQRAAGEDDQSQPGWDFRA